MAASTAYVSKRPTLYTMQKLLQKIEWLTLACRKVFSRNMYDRQESWYFMKLEKEMLQIGKHLIIASALMRERRQALGNYSPFDKRKEKQLHNTTDKL